MGHEVEPSDSQIFIKTKDWFYKNRTSGKPPDVNIRYLENMVIIDAYNGFSRKEIAKKLTTIAEAFPQSTVYVFAFMYQHTWTVRISKFILFLPFQKPSPSASSKLQWREEEQQTASGNDLFSRHINKHKSKKYPLPKPTTKFEEAYFLKLLDEEFEGEK